MAANSNVLKKLVITDNKFNENWDPSKSTRERRKLTKVYKKTKERREAVYDSKGIHIKSGIDVCDCFNLECPGCHFECSKCNSTKCGIVCRVNRRYIYEEQTVDDTNEVTKNPLKEFTK